MDLLISFLGNPGTQYSNTRHNIAWKLCEQFVSKLGNSWLNKFKSEYSVIEMYKKKILILKPQTYMNLSGEAVLSAKDFYKIEEKNILVVHDEVDFEFGQIAYKFGGSAAGNNGIKSVIERTGTDKFYRLRMGIGRPQYGDLASYVLSQFSSDEKIFLDDYIQKACESLNFAIENGWEKALNKYNKKKLV